MNTKQAVVIVLLLALVVLFALTVGIGLRDDRDSGDSSLVDRLKRFQSDRFLVDENSDGCGDDQAIVLASDATCTITVERSGRFSAPIRAVVRVPLGPVRVVVNPDSGRTQSQTIKSRDCSEAAFGRGGGTLDLTCHGGMTGCIVELLRQSCPVEVPL